MLCYIIYPAGLSDTELDSPDCLSQLKVQVSERVCVSVCCCLFSEYLDVLLSSRWVSTFPALNQPLENNASFNVSVSH